VEFAWDAAKSAKVETERGASFERLAETILEGGFLGIEENVGYLGQFFFIVPFKKEIWCVVVEPRGQILRIITAYPSRKWSKKYGG